MIQKLFMVLCLALSLTACSVIEDITGTGDDDKKAARKSSGTGSDVNTTGAPALTTLGYPSFEAAATGAASDDAPKTLVLSGTAVRIFDTASYARPDAKTDWDDDHMTSESITVANIGAPVLSVTFDAYKYVYDNDSNEYIYDEASGNYIYTEETFDNNGNSTYTPVVLDTDANPNALDNVYTDSYISTASIYVGSKNYTVNVDKGDGSRYSISQYGDNDEGNYETLSVSDYFWNNNTDDGFSATYMMNISWFINTEDLPVTGTSGTYSYYDGNMVAGFATDGGAIPNTGTVTFTGFGGGDYSEFPADDLEYDYYQTLGFDVSAVADFAARSVALTTTKTMGCVDTGNDCVDQSLSQLDFTSTLSYAAGDNNLSGTVTADGMSGSVNARFYGPAADEFGGTFGMQKGNDKYYYGWFGAQKPE